MERGKVTKINFEGIEISYREICDPLIAQKPILVLVHGFGGSPRDWDMVVRVLQPDFHIIILNLVHLYYTPSKSLYFSQQVKVLKEIFQHLHEKFGIKINVCAASFGGTMAACAIVSIPECVDKIILVAPMPLHPLKRFSNFLLRNFIRLGSSQRLLLYFIRTPLGKFSLQFFQSIVNMNILPRKRQHLKNLSHRKMQTLSLIIKQFTTIVRREDWSFWRGKWGKLENPVLILWGRKDSLFLKDMPYLMVKKFKNSKLIWIEKAGHLAMKDQPQEVAQNIYYFLNEK